MFIEVDDLRRQTGTEKEFAGRGSRFEIEMQGLPLVFSDIVVTGLARNVGGKIYVKGEVRAKADLTCGLCLNSFSVDVHTPFEEIFYAAAALDASVAEGPGSNFPGRPDRFDRSDHREPDPDLADEAGLPTGLQRTLPFVRLQPEYGGVRLRPAASGSPAVSDE